MKLGGVNYQFVSLNVTVRMLKYNFKRCCQWQSNRPIVSNQLLKAAKSSATVVAKQALEVLLTSQWS